MPQQNGELIDWNDARGFGFIRPDGGGEAVFLHISKIPHAARPQTGDRISFSTSPGRDGKLAATNVRIAGAAISSRHRPRLWIAAILAALVVIGILLGSVPFALAALYLVMGLVSAALYFGDKRRAESGDWRISEARLHAIDLCFGIIGGLLAQQIFRHKTSKQPFAAVTYAIAALHGLVLLALVSERLFLAGFIPG